VGACVAGGSWCIVVDLGAGKLTEVACANALAGAVDALKGAERSLVAAIPGQATLPRIKTMRQLANQRRWFFICVAIFIAEIIYHYYRVTIAFISF